MNENEKEEEGKKRIKIEVQLEKIKRRLEVIKEMYVNVGDILLQAIKGNDEEVVRFIMKKYQEEGKKERE